MTDTMTTSAPASLSDLERIIFAEIMEERPAHDWTPHQVQVAAILAKELRAQNEDQDAIELEGTVLTTRRGNPKLNPRQPIMAKRTAIITSLRRSLGIHARALHGQVRELSRRRAINLAYQAAAPKDDDLLSFPNDEGRDDT